MIKICPVCGKEFETIPRGTKRIYCSTNCAWKFYAANRTDEYRERERKRRFVPPHEKTCARCGGLFMGKYCQKYCIPCLEDMSVNGSPIERKYLENRKDPDGYE